MKAVIDTNVVVDAPPLPKPICRDPGDDMFIACALYGQAECIVSGDKDLRVLNGRIPVAVLSPREFLQRMRGT